MSADQPRAVHDYRSEELGETLEFLKRTRNELRLLRKVRVWTDGLQVFDVNGDYFEVRGLGYGDPNITAVLESINAVFKPDSIHNSIDRPYKEFKTSRYSPWAEDRIL